MQTSHSEVTMPHVVIVGGGAGGLELATTLGHKLGQPSRFGSRINAKITLIDQHQIHIWKPLLHEVATGSLDTEIDGVVYRAHAAKHGYSFQLGSVKGIDREHKTVDIAPIISDENGKTVVPTRSLSYDILVMAIGSISNDFGTPGVSEHCYMLDSKQQAQRFQKSLINMFLAKGQQSSNTDAESPATRLAIVGAGATGVELSAELHHVTDALKVYDVNKSKQVLQIDLIEAGPRILPALPERIAESAAKELTRIGVTIHTNTRITQANESGFIDANQTAIEADMMVWAAGVKVQSWVQDTGLELNRTNQIECLPSLKCKSDDNIYVIGDCCAISTANGSKVPPRAQAAHQMASTAAKNIVRELKGKPLIDFKYTDYGSLVNLSRYSTVGSLMGNLVKGSMFIEGKIARFMYLSLYRMHQLAIHGYAKGPFIIALGRISKLIRPKIKLH